MHIAKPESFLDVRRDAGSVVRDRNVKAILYAADKDMRVTRARMADDVRKRLAHDGQNVRGALVHGVEDGLLLASPGIFRAFVRSDGVGPAEPGDAAKRLQREVLPRLEENQRLSRIAYREGEIGLLQLLLLNRQVLDSRRNLLEAQTELRLTQLAIEGTSGWPGASGPLAEAPSPVNPNMVNP